MITDAGELEARRPLDDTDPSDDRVQRYTTADRDSQETADSQSAYGLSVQAVLDRYAAQADRTSAESRFALAATTANAYRWHLTTNTPLTRTTRNPDHRTTTQHDSNNAATSETSTSWGVDETIAELDLSDRQRHVLAHFTHDTPGEDTPGDEAGGAGADPSRHAVRVRLTAVHTLLTTIPTTNLNREVAGNIRTARDTLHTALQQLNE
ncbi:hypothetical protein [Salarchaeum sp. JOR-1]|uniref:hypothetical protein n=1 Tax=Salarchaeum sp. JOR-1 TaxID=2599399 RepID=UPI00119842FD|nr:hypothetical protein [Salarchaeum sp. JOR-1]QDX41776.1 hypothetical protein FQU85_13000 [Salarchaeum sp. JOR-1]